MTSNLCNIPKKISMENDKLREPSDSLTAEFVLISCILAILFCICCWVYGAFIKVPVCHPIRIEVVESDKMLGSNYISKEEADSLISVIKRQERMMEDKYQYVLDQKMNEDRYFSIGTFVVGVVISIFGFFGFKSLKSIEEKAKEDSQRVATQTSEDVTKEYLKQRLQGLITIESEKLLKSSAAESLKKEILDSVYKKIEENINSLPEEVSETQQTENVSDSDDNGLF